MSTEMPRRWQSGMNVRKRRVIEQRVAAGQHEAIEVTVGGEAQQDAPVVDAYAKRLDRARVP
jgi:hypothetical protein